MWKIRKHYNQFNIWKYRLYCEHFELHENNLKELNSKVMPITSQDVILGMITNYRNFSMYVICMVENSFTTKIFILRTSTLLSPSSSIVPIPY